MTVLGPDQDLIVQKQCPCIYSVNPHNVALLGLLYENQMPGS